MKVDDFAINYFLPKGATKRPKRRNFMMMNILNISLLIYYKFYYIIILYY